jgi:hypothetical protein
MYTILLMPSLPGRPGSGRAGGRAAYGFGSNCLGRKRGGGSQPTLGLPLQASSLDPTILVVILGPNPRSEGTKESD